MFKYELSQVVYYLVESALFSSTVMGRSYDEFVTTPPSNKSHKSIKYRVAGDWWVESQLFSSPEELFHFLKENMRVE